MALIDFGLLRNNPIGINPRAQRDFRNLNQEGLALQRQGQVRDLIGQSMVGQTEQQQMLAEQSQGIGGALAKSEQPTYGKDKIDEAYRIDPIAARTLLKGLGFDDKSKRAEFSRFAATLKTMPYEYREQMIKERAERLKAENRDPAQTEKLLDFNQEQQDQALTGFQMADLSTKDALTLEAKRGGLDTGKIGTYNPRDYTVDSWAEFTRTRNPDVLKRYTEKTVDIGGVQHVYNPDVNGYVPIRSAEKVASNKALIERAVITARADAKDRGETFTELAQMEASLPTLKETVGKLKELAPIVTSTLGGKVYDVAAKELGFGSTKGSTARAKFIAMISNQILPLLKQTFGAAFTAAEGAELKATMGDPDATPEAKMAQLNAFIEQKERDIKAKKNRLNMPKIDGAGSTPPPQGFIEE